MIKILHLFNEYLPKTENWAHQLIAHCEDIEHFIAAQYYNHLDQFSSGVTLLNKSSGLAKMKRAKQSQYDFPRNVLGGLLSLPSMAAPEKSIAALVKKHDIDIIHCHFGTTAIEQWEAIKDIELPLVISFYGWDYAKAIHVNPSYKSQYEVIFQKTSLLLTEGQAGAERLQALSAKKEQIQTLPLGIKINTEDQLLSNRIFKSGDKLRLVQIASIAEKKGQLITLRAFHKILRKYPDQVSLTLVGDSRDIYYAEDVMDLMGHQDMKDHVTHIDWIDSKKINTFLQDFDVFIHPSQYASDGDCEGGSPVILLQAQATGQPVISTHHCDISEQVSHGHSGYLAPEGDAGAIVDIIELFINMSEDHYRQMSAQAVEWVKENFDVKDMGKRLREYYSIVNKS